MNLDDETRRALRHALAPTTAYYVATRALTHGRVARQDALLLARIAVRMSFVTLIQLVRQTHDWCAWVPLLVLVLRARSIVAPDDVRAAEHNLRLLARRLLDAQGLGLVRVDDVLAHPSRLQAAVRELTAGAARR